MSGRERNTLKTSLESEGSCQHNLCKGTEKNSIYVGNLEQTPGDSTELQQSAAKLPGPTQMNQKIPLEVSDTKLKCQLNKEAPEIPHSEKNTESYGTNKARQVHTGHRDPISLPQPSQEALSDFTNIPSSSHRSSSR